VFGPLDRYPTGPSSYAVPTATPSVHRRALAAMRLDRAVLVQPAPYGTDTRVLENALSLGGGRLAGVAAADASVTDKALDRLHALGVRGLRFNERIDPRTGTAFRGAIGATALAALLPRLRERGWHVQIWAGLADCLRLVDEFAGRGVPLVLDHMAQLEPGLGVHDRAFRQLSDRLRTGDVWVKLAFCRVSSVPGHRDVRAHHDALLAANPDRLLWGSDWPYVGMGELAPDAGQLLEVFLHWCADPAIARRVLVDNPGQLFDFTARTMEDR
jgi:predicted TIM-barrel fold metal-dependent hydrolase